MFDDLLEADDEGALLVRLHVQPGAGRTAVVGRHGEAVKVRVAAPPTGGRANDACAELLAAVLGVKADAVTLVAGEASRAKRFRVQGVETADARRLLEQAVEDAAAGPGRARGSR